MNLEVSECLETADCACTHPAWTRSFLDACIVMMEHTSKVTLGRKVSGSFTTNALTVHSQHGQQQLDSAMMRCGGAADLREPPAIEDGEVQDLIELVQVGLQGPAPADYALTHPQGFPDLAIHQLLRQPALTHMLTLKIAFTHISGFDLTIDLHYCACYP